MAILKVSPTRIALLTLKKELKTAQKGHKLLKDKRDGLVKKFMAVIYEAKAVRESVEARLGSAFDSYTRASAMTNAASLDKGWELLKMLPRTSLKRVKAAEIDQYIGKEIV